MRLTNYQAKYIAYELTRRFPPDSVEKLTAALVDAQVDLNPHQIDAALFAFKSPLSKGELLADEVGIGKTIEAGLVISQKWAERKQCHCQHPKNRPGGCLGLRSPRCAAFQQTFGQSLALHLRQS